MEARRPFDLTGRTAIVTGSGRGLGRAAALGLGAAGAWVATNARTPETCAATAAEIRAAGGRAFHRPADIADRAACDRLIAAALEATGRLDILVCNAASNLHAPAAEISPEMWRTCLDIEVTGYFNLCQAAYAPMRDAGGGAIVFVSANSSAVGYAGLATVATAKGALGQLARNLAVEWGPDNIRVNTMNPGYTEHLPPAGDVNPGAGDLEEEVRSLTPLGRRGRLEEFADPVVFLASDAAAFVTGQSLMVDGGYCIK